jgi:hypothetical protein
MNKNKQNIGSRYAELFLRSKSEDGSGGGNEYAWQGDINRHPNERDAGQDRNRGGGRDDYGSRSNRGGGGGGYNSGGSRGGGVRGGGFCLQIFIRSLTYLKTDLFLG